MADTTKLASDEYIRQMYDANLNSQKETLTQGYNQNMAALDTEKKKAQQQTDKNLTRTYVEAAKAGKNYGEVQNAYGLTSGAMAQAKLAQDNTLQQDLTALRGIQMNADADIERQRTLYGQQYASEIAKAQADNDMARAEALYKDASDREKMLLQTQKEIANLFASRGDYSYLQKLYGLTDQQMAQLFPAQSSGGGGDDGGSGGSSPRPAVVVTKPSGSTATYSSESKSSNLLQNMYNRV